MRTRSRSSATAGDGPAAMAAVVIAEEERRLAGLADSTAATSEHDLDALLAGSDDHLALSAGARSGFGGAAALAVLAGTAMAGWSALALVLVAVMTSAACALGLPGGARVADGPVLRRADRATRSARAQTLRIASVRHFGASSFALGLGLVAGSIRLRTLVQLEGGPNGALLASLVAAAAVLGSTGAIRRTPVALLGRPTGVTRRLPVALVVAVGLVTLGALAPGSYTWLLVAPAVAGLSAALVVAGALCVCAVVTPEMRHDALTRVALRLVLGGLTGVVVAAVLQQGSVRRSVVLATGSAFLVAAARASSAGRAMADDIARSRRSEAEALARRTRPTTADTPVLALRHVDFSYGHVQVLFDVSLEVAPGEVLALLGTNGAGKSTLLRAVSGLSPVDRGTLEHRGEDITFADAGARVRAGIVQLPGGKAIFPTLTVVENLMAGAYTYVWDRARLAQRIDETLDIFPVLRQRLDQPAGTLSGGEQQMLAFAKALLLDPDILCIDELSLGLAPVVVQELIEIVEGLKAQGLTMVVVEQSLNVALAIADRAVFMEKGRIRFDGPARELAERGDLARAVFLGGEGG